MDERLLDIPDEAFSYDPAFNAILISPSAIRDVMRAQGKSNKEICAALGVRHTDDVPHPVEHIRFGRRLRSHKVNRLVG